MEYSRYFFMWMVVMALFAVGSGLKECTKDDFNFGKSSLFSEWCNGGGCKLSVLNYNDIGNFDKPVDASNDYAGVIDRTHNIKSDPFNVSEGSVISFYRAVKKGNLLAYKVTIKIYDPSSPNLNIPDIIINETESDWTEKKIVWNNPETEIVIEIDSSIFISGNYLVVDKITVSVEDDASCPGEDPSQPSSTTDSSSSTQPTDPDQCSKDLEDMTSEMETWRIVSIVALSAAGVLLISTITLSVLLAKKANSVPEAVVDPWNTKGPPAYPYANSIAGSVMTELPRVRSAPRARY